MEVTAITAEQLAEWKALAEKATDGPWHVRDFRATEMRRLGWSGPSIDRILVTTGTGAEIEAASGAASVVDRIQFDNRPDELGEINRNDADLMAVARTAVPALVAEVERLRDFVTAAVVAFDLAAELMPENVINFSQFAADARTVLPEGAIGSGQEPGAACDCQNPDGEGVRHVSMECPVHNDNPYTAGGTLCSDCPPIGYPTDKTRCVECPRRA